MQEPTEPIAIDRPWSPLAIAVLTLLFSPLAGGILHGLNYARLGQARLRRFALARSLLAGLLLILPATLLRQSTFNPVASLFIAAYFYKSQEDLFQEHLSQGGRKGSPWTAILIALLAALDTALFGIVFFLLSR